MSMNGSLDRGRWGEIDHYSKPKKNSRFRNKADLDLNRPLVGTRPRWMTSSNMPGCFFSR